MNIKKAAFAFVCTVLVVTLAGIGHLAGLRFNDENRITARTVILYDATNRVAEFKGTPVPYVRGSFLDKETGQRFTRPIDNELNSQYWDLFDGGKHRPQLEMQMPLRLSDIQEPLNMMPTHQAVEFFSFLGAFLILIFGLLVPNLMKPPAKTWRMHL